MGLIVYKQFPMQPSSRKTKAWKQTKHCLWCFSSCIKITQSNLSRLFMFMIHMITRVFAMQNVKTFTFALGNFEKVWLLLVIVIMNYFIVHIWVFFWSIQKCFGYLNWGSGFILQNHLSGSLLQSIPSGSLRHFKQSSHCTQFWSGRFLESRLS